VRASAYDPSPRIPITLADHFAMVDSTRDGFDIVSCVVPTAAEQAPEAVRPLRRASSIRRFWAPIVRGSMLGLLIASRAGEPERRRKSPSSSGTSRSIRSTM
jgi:hypothetical protein